MFLAYDPQPENNTLSKCQILSVGNICNKKIVNPMDYYQIITASNSSKLLLEFKVESNLNRLQ